MTTETSRFAPSLIDAMHGIVAIDGLVEAIHRQEALSLITVMIQDDMHWSVLFWCNAEDGGMAIARHLHLQMFLRQTDGIIMGMRHFFCMRKRSSPLHWL